MNTRNTVLGLAALVLGACNKAEEGFDYGDNQYGEHAGDAAVINGEVDFMSVNGHDALRFQNGFGVEGYVGHASAPDSNVSYASFGQVDSSGTISLDPEYVSGDDDDAYEGVVSYIIPYGGSIPDVLLDGYWTGGNLDNDCDKTGISYREFIEGVGDSYDAILLITDIEDMSQGPVWDMLVPYQDMTGEDWILVRPSDSGGEDYANPIDKEEFSRDGPLCNGKYGENSWRR